MNTITDRHPLPPSDRNETGVRPGSRMGQLFERFQERTDLPVVYISGPMSGRENFNFPYFNAVARKLRIFGFPILNPADFGADPAKSWEDCLARDVECLKHADILVLLKGWEASKGAAVEYDAAYAMGKPIVLLTDFVHKVVKHFFDPEFIEATRVLDEARSRMVAVFNESGEAAVTTTDALCSLLIEFVKEDFMVGTPNLATVA